MDGDNKQVDLIYGAAIDKISRARIKCPRIFYPGGYNILSGRMKIREDKIYRYTGSNEKRQINSGSSTILSP